MRLKGSQVAGVRTDLLTQQNHTCPLCSCTILDPVLDHAHGSDRGWIRATICRSCNLFLGKIEQHKRYKIQDVVLFLKNTAEYLTKHSTNQTGLIHPSMRTPVEKKLLAKKRKAKRDLKSS